MRTRIGAGLAMATGLALTLVSGLPQAAQASQPSIFHTGVSAASPAGQAAAVPQTAKLLYDQNNDASGNSAGSINWGKGNADDTQVADDFTVPKGQTWMITKVNVTGDPTSSTPKSENLLFYKNTINVKKQDVPGRLVTPKQTLKGKDSSGSLTITGITGVKLTAGHYWLSVQANIPTGEAWYWESRTVQSGSPGVFENPGNAWGTGCTAWTPWETCAGAGASGSPDFMFALYGSKT